MYDVVVKKFTFAISSPDEFLFAQLTAESPYTFIIGRPFSPSKLSLRVRDPDPHLIMFPWAHRAHNPNDSSINSAVLHSSRQTINILYNWLPLSASKSPFSLGSGPHLRYGSSYSPESTTQTACRSLQPFYRPTGRQTERLTDHATPSATISASTYVVRRCGLIIILGDEFQPICYG